mmetsp:Transcript_63905/g.152418  ORF Transcript_63905/g.152418 Transcript_63905/m.152418 type:complete len:590 (+) Transcript_63905:95-1864(+)
MAATVVTTTTGFTSGTVPAVTSSAAPSGGAASSICASPAPASSTTIVREASYPTATTVATAASAAPPVQVQTVQRQTSARHSLVSSQSTPTLALKGLVQPSHTPTRMSSVQVRAAAAAAAAASGTPTAPLSNTGSYEVAPAVPAGSVQLRALSPSRQSSGHMAFVTPPQTASASALPSAVSFAAATPPTMPSTGPWAQGPIIAAPPAEAGTPLPPGSVQLRTRSPSPQPQAAQMVVAQPGTNATATPIATLTSTSLTAAPGTPAMPVRFRSVGGPPQHPDSNIAGSQQLAPQIQQLMSQMQQLQAALAEERQQRQRLETTVKSMQARLDKLDPPESPWRAALKKVELRQNVRVDQQSGNVTLLRPIEFVPKTSRNDPVAEFRRPEAADEICKDLAEVAKLFRCPMTVEGHTKGGESTFWMTLAQDRARAVRDKIVEFGADADKVSALGLPGKMGRNEVKTVIYMDLSEMPDDRTTVPGSKGAPSSPLMRRVASVDERGMVASTPVMRRSPSVDERTPVSKAVPSSPSMRRMPSVEVESNNVVAQPVATVNGSQLIHLQGNQGMSSSQSSPTLIPRPAMPRRVVAAQPVL